MKVLNSNSFSTFMQTLSRGLVLSKKLVWHLAIKASSTEVNEYHDSSVDLSLYVELVKNFELTNELNMNAK